MYQQRQAEVKAQMQALKTVEKQEAITLERAAQIELVKQKEDQKRRRMILERNQQLYKTNVMPTLQAKQLQKEELTSKYIKQRDERLAEESFRKSEQKELFKITQASDLARQLEDKQRETEMS